MNTGDPLYKYPNYNDAPKYSPLNISGKWDSLYIPYVQVGEINAVVDALENKFAIGKVKYVDRKPRPKNGSDADYFSLFVHFDYWFNSDFAIFLRYYLDKQGKYDISNYYRYYYKNHHSREDRFDFHILINRSSRQRTYSDTNIHTYSGKPTHPHSPPLADEYMSYNELLRDTINEKAKFVSQPENEYKYMISNIDGCHSPHSRGDLTAQLEKHERLIALLSDEIAALRELVYKYTSATTA